MATPPASTCDARLRATAARRPDAQALVAGDETMTWAALDRRVDAGAAALASLGVGPGDRVAIVLGNVPAFVEAWYAVLRAGAVAVPAAPALAPDEVRHVLANAGARVVVATPAVGRALATLRDELPALEHVVVVADADTPASEMVGGDGTPHWDALLGSVAAGPPPPSHGADDLAALVHTSGTGGRPRGAMLTHGNLVANQDQSLAGRHRLEPDDRVLLVLPLFHVYGLNVGLGPAVAVGACMVLQDRFDPEDTARLVAEQDVSVVLGAPPMYVAWAASPPVEQLAGVRLFASGAAPLPVAVGSAFAAAVGTDVREGYGLTEAGPSVTSSALDDDVRPGSVGRALPDVQLRIVERGEDVEPGEVGEVWVRGPNVFQGYWQDDEATADALVDGWLRTRDVGVLDEAGWLRLVDRSNDLVIVSGFNVYPREVERVLLAHPQVQEAAAFGRPHPLTGEVVAATVVPTPGAAPTEDELLAHCATRLARYKLPASVAFADALPRTVTGKVRRTDLQLG